MQNFRFLAPLLALAVALAGCAGDTEDPSGTTTPTGTTPEATTPTSPTGTTSMTPTPVDGNGTDEPVMPVDCGATATSGETNASEIRGYPHLVFTVGTFSASEPCATLEGPTNATAGWTAITLENAGNGAYILPMTRLDEGRSYEDYLANAGQDAEWAVPVGGVGGVTPTASGTVLVNLTEGTYVLTLVNVADFSQPAILRSLNVTAADDDTASAPEATLTVELRDYAFVLPENITAGTHIIRFVNNGTEPHEAPLVKLTGNATMVEFIGFFGPEGGHGAPPGALVGGVNVLAPGETAYALVDLSAGNYGFACFVESHEHGDAPHFTLGMIAEFTVE